MARLAEKEIVNSVPSATLKIECDECALILESEEALHTHQTTEHCTEFECSNCNYKSDNWNYFTEHIKEHTKTNYNCNLCKK